MDLPVCHRRHPLRYRYPRPRSVLIHRGGAGNTHPPRRGSVIFQLSTCGYVTRVAPTPGHVGHSDGRRPRRRGGRLKRARGRATGGVAPYGFYFIDGRRAWHQGEQETHAAGFSWAKVGPTS